MTALKHIVKSLEKQGMASTWILFLTATVAHLLFAHLFRTI